MAKRIAILKLGGLGDLIMATPAFASLAKSYPDYEIFLITGKSNKAVLANAPYFKKQYAIDDHKLFKGSPLDKAQQASRLWSILVSNRPEKILVLHRDWRFNLLAKAAAVPERYGFSRDKAGKYLTGSIENDQSQHETDKYHALFGLLESYSPLVKQLQLYPSKKDKQEVKKITEGFSTENSISIVLGGASNAKMEGDHKRYKAAHYQAIAEHLLKRGYSIVLPGGPGDQEAAAAFANGLSGSGEQVLNICGRLSVAGTYLLLQECKLMISHDCGPMHIGAAAGIPVLALFGATDPREYGSTQHPKSTILWKGKNMACSPCYDHGYFPPCPFSYECMENIEPEEVIQKAMHILGEQ